MVQHVFVSYMRQISSRCRQRERERESKKGERERERESERAIREEKKKRNCKQGYAITDHYEWSGEREVPGAPVILTLQYKRSPI